MARLRDWVQASRPLALVLFAPPLLYGQALAYAAHGAFRWKLFGLVHLFGVLDQLLVVFANDAADWQTDTQNRTFNRFSGGSRVVPEGKLTPFALAQGALLALLAMGTTSAYLVFHEGRAWMVVLAAIAAHLLWVHGFPPFRLSYRGRGEILQGIGLGLLLPVVGFYVQANTLEGLKAATLLPAFLLGYAGNVTTALPDTPSDRESGKRTFSVRRGERAARRTSVALITVATLATPLAASRASIIGWAVTGLAAGVILSRSFRLIPTADATRKDECERFVSSNLAATLAVISGWAVALFVSR